MAFILNLETATTMCSVAFARDGKVIALKEQNNGYTHAESLTLFIQTLINEAGYNIKDLDAVAISKGPGSYTGLRIGTSVAKGLCYGLDKPLIAINTLDHFVTAVACDANTLKCPMLDARRMEVYCAVYDSANNCIIKTSADIITAASFSDILVNNKMLFFGDGAAKCTHLFKEQPNAVFIDELFPSAVNMAPVAEQLFIAGKFEDVAYFEPFYLKDFIGTVPKKK